MKPEPMTDLPANSRFPMATVLLATSIVSIGLATYLITEAMSSRVLIAPVVEDLRRISTRLEGLEKRLGEAQLRSGSILPERLAMIRKVEELISSLKAESDSESVPLREVVEGQKERIERLEKQVRRIDLGKSE